MRAVVVGAGLVGLATAQALLECGLQVRVVEARSGVGQETSFANSGLITPSMPEPWNSPGVYKNLAASLFDSTSTMRLRLRSAPSLLSWGIRFLRNSSAVRFRAATLDNYRLARYSRDKTESLSVSLNLSYDRSDRGTLSVFRNLDVKTTRHEVASLLIEQGLTVRELDVKELLGIEPVLQPISRELSGGLWFPDDDCGDAHQFCRELVRKISEAGGVIDTSSRVSQLLLRSDQVVGVCLDGDEIEADYVIVAAGPWSNALLDQVGCCLPIQPAKGYSLTFDGCNAAKLPRHPILDEDSHVVVTPFGQRIRVVSFAEFAGFDKSIPQARVDYLMTAFESLLPEIVSKIDRTAATAWAGFRPMSNDGRPFIGPGPVEGLFVNTGHGALGWTMAVGSACLLADQITGRPTEIEKKPFLPSRVQ